MWREGGWWVALLVVAAGLATGVVLGPAAAGSTLDTGLSDEGTWSETYTPSSESGRFDAGIRTAAGGFLLVGQFGPRDGTDTSALAVKVDARGAVEWVWSLQGYGNATLAGAVQLDDGRYLVGGTRRTPETGPERFVAVLTADGQVAWRDTYGQGRVTDVVRAPDGALLVGGDTAGVVTANGGDLWVRQYADVDVAAAARIDDGYVLAGAATGGGPVASDHPDRLLIRIDATGEPVWRSRAAEQGPDRFADVLVDEDVIYAGGAAPLGDGSTVHPSVSAYHSNGSRDWSSTSRQELPNETVTGLAMAKTGVVAASRSDTESRLTVVAPSVAGQRATVDSGVNSVTSLGNGRYLLAGDRNDAAFGAVVRPDFAPSAAGETGDAAGEGGGDDGDAQASEPADGGSSDGTGSDGGGLPAVGVGTVPPAVTLILVVAAAIASLVAIAVTILSIREL